MATTQAPPPETDKQPFEVKRPGEGPRFRGSKFWFRVGEGIELENLWSQFKADAQASYGHYSQDVDWAEIEKEKGFKRGWRIAKAFFLAMLLKLSPPRRVALLIALLLILVGRFEVRNSDWNASVSVGGIGIAILLLLLAMELADRVTMKRDLEIAREIQRWLVPSEAPKVAGADFAFATRPANTVAGDYYDVFFRGDEGLGSRRLLCVVADVAGKSVPAALLMATLQASLQALAAATDSLVELVVKLNRYACAHSLGGMRFTTAFIAELDPNSRVLTYICAGHNAAALRRASGTIERLDVGGLPLGITADAEYGFARAKLAAGDLLVIFTDGLVEAFNEKGEEFGDGRLIPALAALPEQSANESLKQLMSTVDGFVGATRQHDDITAMVMKIV